MADRIKKGIVGTTQRVVTNQASEDGRMSEQPPSDPIVRAKNNLVVEGEHETRENSRQWHGYRYPYAHPVRIITTFRHEFTAIAWALVALVERMDKLVELLSGREHQENGSGAPPLEKDH